MTGCSQPIIYVASVSRAWATVALFAAAAVLSAFTILREIGPHDEGLMLQAAARMARGERPYRDFWWNHGPGQPLVPGALWKAGRPSLLPRRSLPARLPPTAPA